MGADLAYMVPRFINTKESLADEDYKNMTNSTADDIIYTAVVSGVKANFIKQSLKQWELLKMIGTKQKNKLWRRIRCSKAEAKAWKTIWSAGQGVTSIKDCPSVSKLILDLKSEFIDSIKGQSKLLQTFN